MSGTDSGLDPGLDICGACAGTSPQTPALVDNRAGLAAVGYRVGTHAMFKASMEARLGALPGLRTRDSGDFTIGLVDAWATVADVLTFYQERIANESYLRTATERRSLARLGELIGYTPQPGVAASTWLAFTIGAAPVAAGSTSAPVTVPAGTRVQSLPAPGGLPQTFETTADVPARADWNAMRPSLSQPQPITTATNALLVTGTTTGLKPGDGLVIAATDGSRPVLRTGASLATEPGQPQTWVNLRPTGGAVPAAPPPPPAPPTPRPRFFFGLASMSTVPLSLSTSFAAPRDWSFVTQQATVQGRPFVARAADLEALGWRLRLPVSQLLKSLAAWSPPVAPSVYALRTKASLFGYNAPDAMSLSDVVRGRYGLTAVNADWPLPGNLQSPLLDTTYPRIAADTPGAPSYAALKWHDSQGEHWVVVTVAGVTDTGYSNFTLSGKATQLSLTLVGDSDTNAVDLNGNIALGSFPVYRSATVLAESDPLPLARLPRTGEPLPATSQIDLDTWVDGLYAGQWLVVSGELDQSRGTFASEAVQVQAVDQVIDANGATRLTLASALTQAYVRESVTICGNVAPATHGATVQEVIGSGDATAAGQRFTLRQQPLTYVSAGTASGVSSTLALRVNGLLWSEAPDFFGAAPGDRIYTARLNDDGTTTLAFGDGTNGARPASGTENITATYRKGIGSLGNVAAGQLSLLQQRPLGVQSVTNPVAAAGGTDAETSDDIRANAALTLRTLGRIVSLQDYEDFARAFGGIAKALASWAWHGRSRGVFLTVAGVGGADVPADGLVYGHLLAAIAAAAEPNTPVKLASYRRASFTFSASLVVDPAYRIDDVVAAAEARARDAFSFERRSFGQPVPRSEVIALLQGVPGVVAVAVSSLVRTDTALFIAVPLDAVLREGSQLVAALPQTGADDTALAAELLTLDPRALNLVGTLA